MYHRYYTAKVYYLWMYTEEETHPTMTHSLIPTTCVNEDACYRDNNEHRNEHCI